MLAHLDQRLPATLPVGSPTGVSLTTARLDRGRVAMTDACREFGWASGTRVEVTASGGAVTVVGIADDGDATGQRLDRDGRVLIGNTLRRLLNLTTDDRVLVATCHHPAPSVRIVPMDVAARALMTAGVLPGLTEGETR